MNWLKHTLPINTMQGILLANISLMMQVIVFGYYLGVFGGANEVIKSPIKKIANNVADKIEVFGIWISCQY